MENLTSLAVRLIAGLPLALGIGFAGMLFTGILIPPAPAEEWMPLAARIAMIGMGAAIGASIAWFNLIDDRRITVALLLISLAGGLAGAWVGMVWGETYVEDGDLFKVSQGISQVSVIGAAVGANLLPAAVGMAIQQRLRR